MGDANGAKGNPERIGVFLFCKRSAGENDGTALNPAHDIFCSLLLDGA